MLRVCILALLALVPVGLAAQALKVGVAQDRPPLSYSHDGQVVGIGPDNARAVGSLLNVEVQLVPMPYADLLRALQAGAVDVVMSGVPVTPANSALVDFAAPYLQTGQMAIIRQADAGRLAFPWAVYGEGVRIGVQSGSAGEVFALAELQDAVVKTYAGADAGLAALQGREIDLFVHDPATSWRLATSDRYPDLLALYEPLTEQALAWAVRKGDDALRARLDDSLATMRSRGVLDYILGRWIPVRTAYD